MKKYDRQGAGRVAEMQALAFLERNGMHLLQKNYRCYSGEIDLIMQDRDDIVFVEVRSRANSNYGSAVESVTLTKQRKLCKAAIHFLQLKKWLYKINSRFDIIAIQTMHTQTQLEWIKHAFEVRTYL